MADRSTCHRAADSVLIPHLPDDLSLQCIARVPRSSHPSLLLVSRSWCSLLRSRRLFALRAELGVTEPSLFVNIYTLSGESRLYFLNLRPCRLLPIPPPPFPTCGVGCAVIGSSLYVLGGCHDYNYHPQELTSIPNAAVQIFDPCLNRWTNGPPMAEPRSDPVVSEFNGRLYVFGGCVCPFGLWSDGSDPDSGAWAEVFDPATGAWASLPWRPAHLRKSFVNKSAIFRGKILLDNGLFLDLEAAQPWGTVPKALRNGLAAQAVVLDGVLYSYNFKGKLSGYDQAGGVWKPVDGVEGEVPEYLHCSELTKLGGLLCLIWTHTTATDKELERRMRGRIRLVRRIKPDMNELHCVGVQITRTSCGGFRGSIAWRKAVANPISNSLIGNSVVLEF